MKRAVAGIAACLILGATASCSTTEYTTPEGPTPPAQTAELRPAVLNTLDDFRTEADRIGRVYAPCARDVSDPSTKVSEECKRAVPVGKELVIAMSNAAGAKSGGWPDVVEEGRAILTAATLASEICDRPSGEIGGYLEQCQDASFKMWHAGEELQKALTIATTN